MKHVLINSELPIQMLNKNNKVNDFDFVLFSLWEKYPAYKEFFLKNRKEYPERVVIFDNSAYEFFNNGELFDEVKFEEAVKELNPTYYIVPDVLMDQKETIDNWSKWNGKLPDYGKMVVPQGRSLKEWLECYKLFIKDPDVKMIGIPFHNDFFYDMGLAATMIEANNDHRRDMAYRYIQNDIDFFYAFGRILLLQYLEDYGLINPSIKYHLLGTHHWNEMKSLGLQPKKFIYSADTSYPVTRGLSKKPLDDWSPKEVTSIEFFIDMEISDKQEDWILKNIKKFHKYVEAQ